MKVGSLFSGIGGIDLGFEQAGFKISWANEIDVLAGKTYKYNFPNTDLIESDICDINPEILSDIDVLTAGFPCQPFSIMGYKRGFKDPRGNLFFEILRILDIKRPKIIFLENVKNLINHDNGKTFLVIYNTLAELGYFVRYKIIDAPEANIPQTRKRIYIVAFMDENLCHMFKFPDSLELTKTLDDILNRSVKHSDIYYYKSENRYYYELNRKIKDKVGIYRIDDSGIANKKYIISPTLKANMGTYPDRVPIIRDDFGIRKITPYECLALQGFPQEFKFPKIPMASAYKQCGNSVVVPVIRRIAEQIKKVME